MQHKLELNSVDDTSKDSKKLIRKQQISVINDFHTKKEDEIKQLEKKIDLATQPINKILSSFELDPKTMEFELYNIKKHKFQEDKIAFYDKHRRTIMTLVNGENNDILKYSDIFILEKTSYQCSLLCKFILITLHKDTTKAKELYSAMQTFVECKDETVQFEATQYQKTIKEFKFYVNQRKMLYDELSKLKSTVSNIAGTKFFYCIRFLVTIIISHPLDRDIMTFAIDRFSAFV